MEESNRHIVCALFLTGILCACGSGASTASGQEASIASAATPTIQPTLDFLPSPISTTTTAVPITSEDVPSSTSEPGPGPQESPVLSPTLDLTPNPTRLTTIKAPLCNDSLFVVDVTIPDGTIVAPGTDFVKTWRVRNTGTCGWTTSYAIGFAYGNAMNGIDTKLPKSVNSGGEVDLSVKMTAPQANGWYGGWWRLRNETGSYFGDFVYVSILVSNGQETSTPSS
jgi:hypothetical protein